MKKIIFFLLFLLAIFVSRCVSPNSPSGQQSSTTTESQPAVEQEIVSFDIPGEISLAKNFYFLLDCSGSMDENCSGRRKIDGAKEAMIRFLKNVPSDANIGLLAFGVGGGSCKEILPIGKNDFNALKKAISSLEPSGQTPLGGAIAIGTKKLIEQYKKQLGYGEYRLIAITDGNNTDGDAMVNACKELTNYGFITLYSISLCMDTGNPLKNFALSSRDASNYEELEKALIETAAESDAFDSSVFDSTLFRK